MQCLEQRTWPLELQFFAIFRNLDSRKRHKLVKLRIRSTEDARRQMHSGLTVLCGCWRLWVVTLWRSVVARRHKVFTTLKPPRSVGVLDGVNMFPLAVVVQDRSTGGIAWVSRFSRHAEP
jgi:hypothetical protein